MILIMTPVVGSALLNDKSCSPIFLTMKFESSVQKGSHPSVVPFKRNDPIFSPLGMDQKITFGPGLGSFFVS